MFFYHLQMLFNNLFVEGFEHEIESFEKNKEILTSRQIKQIYSEDFILSSNHSQSLENELTNRSHSRKRNAYGLRETEYNNNIKESNVIRQQLSNSIQVGLKDVEPYNKEWFQMSAFLCIISIILGILKLFLLMNLRKHGVEF